jgi:hypothetical protein
MNIWVFSTFWILWTARHFSILIHSVLATNPWTWILSCLASTNKSGRITHVSNPLCHVKRYNTAEVVSEPLLVLPFFLARGSDFSRGLDFLFLPRKQFWKKQFSSAFFLELSHVVCLSPTPLRWDGPFQPSFVPSFPANAQQPAQLPSVGPADLQLHGFGPSGHLWDLQEGRNYDDAINVVIFCGGKSC